ncbi:hypothetical protein VTK26DRAFT_9435 [Humicola hyalothermophila]
MDAPTHFFSDCLDFDDPNSYQSPDQDTECGSISLQPFNPYAGKLDIGGPSTPVYGGDLVPRADVWDGFPEQIGSMVGVEQKPLFVDPGLYSPENESEDTRAQIQVIPITVSRASTRRTSSSKFSRRTSQAGSTSTDITPPDLEQEPQESPEPQEPPRKRRARKTKKETSTAEEEQKRNKFLERNRIAASKCREKKKLYVSELEETKISLEAQHTQLQMEYNSLVGEISGLKHSLMAHAKCNDPNIDRWLNNEARKFVETTDEAFGQPFNNPFAQPCVVGQTPALPGSPRSRNPSIASSSYPSLSSVQFDRFGPGERQGSIAYSHGTAPSLYTSPTEEAFTCLPPTLKREPGINYDHMPDSMFSPDQSTFGGG